MTKTQMPPVILLLTMSALIVRGAEAGQDVKTSGALAAFSRSVESLVRRVSPSVVQVVVTGYGPLRNTDRDDATVVIGRQRGLGSGVIIDPNGFIVTNAHVVAGALSVQVTLPPPAPTSDESPAHSLVSGRGRTVVATVVGTAPEVDLALLKVEAVGLPAIALADYEDLRQGEVVFALGSPEGLRNSATMGGVSSVARQPDTDSPMVFIQTDAPINPGNSGGPLVNVAGELVGINTFILTESSGNQGLGFAVPSAIVAVTWTQLRQFGHLHRGEIGLSLQSITPDLASALELPRDFGVLVSDVVADGPAAAAGVQIQDIVVSVNGNPVDSYFTMFGQTYTRAPGEHLSLGLLRGSTRFDTEVVVRERPHGVDHLMDEINPRTSLIVRLGVLGVPVDDDSDSMGHLRLPFGVIVVGRSERQPTVDVPLSAGDVIHTVNGVAVSSVRDLDRLMNELPAQSAVALQIEHDGQLRFVTVIVE